MPTHHPEVEIDFFNWTMTPLSESEVHWPIARFTNSSTDPRWVSGSLDGKTKWVAVIFRDCDQYARAKGYFAELNMHIDVDIYSVLDCGDDTVHKITMPLGDFDKFLVREYRYYFALEKSLCKDYITEETWR